MHECDTRRAGLRDAYVEVLCTRGRPAPGSRDPRTCVNTFMAFAIPFVWIADPRSSAAASTSWSARRSESPASVDPRVKNYHWMDFVMGLFEAYERGGETVVLTDGRGNVTEGPGFNVFAVFGQGRVRVVTPAAGVLEGISRRTAIDSRRPPDTVEQRLLPVDELRRADEIFLSSTGGGVIPIARLDGLVGGRAPGDFGPVSADLQQTRATGAARRWPRGGLARARFPWANGVASRHQTWMRAAVGILSTMSIAKEGFDPNAAISKHTRARYSSASGDSRTPPNSPTFR